MTPQPHPTPQPSDASAAEKLRVPALARAAAILDLISASDHAPGVSEIARALGLAKSSVHALCETLTELGLLRATEAGFAPGPRALTWGAAFLARNSLVDEFRRRLSLDERLRGYTATLSTLDGAEVVYLGCHNSDKPLGFTFQAGMRLPAVYTATGKAMLSVLPADERARLIAGPWRAPFTANGVRNADDFEAECARWRAYGYAVDNGEIRAGMLCLGAPILNAEGRPTAGLAISMTTAEGRSEARETLGAIIAEVARDLSFGL